MMRVGALLVLGLAVVSATVFVPTAYRVGQGPPPFPHVPMNKHHFNVTMSDGVVLTSTLYTLKDVQIHDTKLAITHQSFPYGAMTEKFIALLWGLSPLLKLQKRHGLLLTHTRGSAPNSGRFPGFRQTRDVQEWVAWLQRQPWYNGVLFSTGLSAMGVMSYLSAMVGVPVKAQSVSIAGADEYRLIYRNGAYRALLVNSMLEFVGQPSYNLTYVAHEAPSDWWSATNLAGHYDDVKWPALHQAGWYDAFLQDTLDVYHNYRTHASSDVRDLQFLIVGPNGHCFGGGAIKWDEGKTKQLQLLGSVIEAVLFGVLSAADTPLKFTLGLDLLKVLFKPVPRAFWYVMGPGLEGSKGNWIAAGPALPDPTPKAWYLTPGGGLSESAPATPAAAAFLYDPADPVRTRGGCIMGAAPGQGDQKHAIPCGPWDQLPVTEGRRDVLTYTSAALPEDMAITGHTTVVLHVGSNATDTDFTAKLVDVFPNGTRLLLQDGIQRMRWRELHRGPQPMNPGETYRIEIDLWSTSYIFNAGHRIGVDVSSSNAPQYNANPNTGLPLKDAAPHRTAIANNTVHMGPAKASYLRLPVVPMAAAASFAEGAVQELLRSLNATTLLGAPSHEALW